MKITARIRRPNPASRRADCDHSGRLQPHVRITSCEEEEVRPGVTAGFIRRLELQVRIADRSGTFRHAI
jgi:hypothetical protein